MNLKFSIISNQQPHYIMCVRVPLSLHPNYTPFSGNLTTCQNPAVSLRILVLRQLDLICSFDTWMRILGCNLWDCKHCWSDHSQHCKSLHYLLFLQVYRWGSERLHHPKGKRHRWAGRHEGCLLKSSNSKALLNIPGWWLCLNCGLLRRLNDLGRI